MNKNFLIAMFVLIVSVQVAFAEDMYPGVYQFDSCNVEYMKDIADSYMELTGKDFSDKIAEIESDLVKLKENLDANQPLQYRNYKIQSYRPHMNALANSYRTEFRSLNASTKLVGIQRLVNHLKDLNTCYTGSLTTALNNKIAYYDTVIVRYKAERDALVAKGVNSTNMDKEIADAEAFMVELRAKAQNATTLQEKRLVFQGYCLANGCAVSVSGATLWNQHLHAKFALAKIKDTLAYLRPMAEAKGLTADLDDIEKDIAKAEAQVASAGKQRYNSVQVSTFWGALKSASAKMAVLLPKLSE